MADLFPACAVGETPFPEQALIIPMKCGASVTKGQVVKFSAHTSGEICSVEPATAACLNAVGVAMKSGSAGETIPVIIKGIVKVTAAAAITGGTRVICAANGQIDTYPASPAAGDDRKVIGTALQTFANGDTGLIELHK